MTRISLLAFITLHAGLAGLHAQGMSVGQNLDEITDWTTAPGFVNNMKMARSWMTRTVNDSEWDSYQSASIPLRNDGYPQYVPFFAGGANQWVHTMMPIFENGSHRIVIEGNGEVRINGPGIGTTDYLINGSRDFTVNISGANDITALDWTGLGTRNEPSHLYIVIKQSSSSNPIRNIRVMRPGHHNASKDAFDPALLANLQPFTTIRFMDWQKTNRNIYRTTWNIPQNSKDYYTQATEYGVAIDHCLDLAEQTGKHIWLCVPERMSDQGIHDMAQYLASRLPAGRLLYIEYTNEHWNGMFTAGSWITSQPFAGATPHEKYGTRSKFVFDAFKQKFDAVGKGSQLRRTLAGQAPNIGVMQQALNTAAASTDVIAIAPYFGTVFTTNEVPSIDALTTETYAKFNEVRTGTQQHRDLAQSLGKTLVCYEGGQHYVGDLERQNNNALTARLIELNRDWRMRNMYRNTYLNDLASRGVSLFMNFSLCSRWAKTGSWGTMEYWSQTIGQNAGNAQKEWAVRDWMANNPASGGGTPPPPPPPSGGTNLAQGKSATASSTEAGRTPALANDGNTGTRWAAANGNFPAWWEVDLGSAHNVTSSEIIFEGASAWKYRIEGRASASDPWTTLVDKTGNSTSAQTFSDSLSNGSNKRFIRVTITGYNGGYFWASMFEFRIFNGGSSGGGTPPPGNGLPGAGSGSGSITRDVWTGISGTAISDIPLSTAPSSTGTLSSFEAPTNAGDNYGQRIEGFLHPSTSGSYTFWIAGDDSVELWLSTNDNPASATRIAHHNGWTSSREWNKYPTQKSTAINLTAGQRYYIRALMKEGGGGDSLAVSWRLNSTDPGNGDGTFIIPGSALSPRNGSSGGGTESFHETFDPATAKSSHTHRVFSEGIASGGSCAVLEGTATGAFVTYQLSNVPAGTYRIFIRHKRANNRAQFQVATADTLNGTYTNRGSVIDGYSGSFDYVEVEAGTVTFSSTGNRFIRFTATGKNSASSSFWMAIDRIRLAP